MKIRKFNEQAEPAKDKLPSFIELNGEIWISKKVLIYNLSEINKYIDGAIKPDDNRDLSIKGANLNIMLKGIVNMIKKGINGVGEKPNPFDPYNEEVWDENI